MKVALVHDYLKEYGGAERVLEALHQIWPEAPLFTAFYLPEFLGPHRLRFADWEIRVSWLQKIPGVEKLVSPLRIFSPWVFENFDFRGFDLVFVSSTGAYFPNLLLLRPETLHFCYCHTPPRYLYGYPTARNWQKYFLGRVFGQLSNHYLRQIDFLSYQRPDFILANSQEVKRRIEKFYRREAKVIYPPVGLRRKVSLAKSGKKAKNWAGGRKGYYLAGGRLARAKRIDLAILACNQLKLPLKIFGKAFAGYGEELKKMAGPTIEFLGEVEEEKLAKLYAGAQALIYPAQEEDFGIVPVEAQSFGVPVIALKGGGVQETVVEGKTGVFFSQPTVESLVAALKKFQKLRLKAKDCQKNAEKFSKKKFLKEVKSFVEEKWEERKKTLSSP